MAENVWQQCGRCSGKGHVRGFENVAGGVCFQCGGTGGTWVTPATLARRAKAQEAKARKEAEQAAAKATARTERFRNMTQEEREEWTREAVHVTEDGMVEMWTDDTFTETKFVTVAKYAADLTK